MNPTQLEYGSTFAHIEKNVDTNQNSKLYTTLSIITMDLFQLGEEGEEALMELLQTQIMAAGALARANGAAAVQ